MGTKKIGMWRTLRMNRGPKSLALQFFTICGVLLLLLASTAAPEKETAGLRSDQPSPGYGLASKSDPPSQLSSTPPTFRIGWISPMTGPAAKYGADKAALLAVEHVNARGGILGRPLELIMEDGKCSGPEAASAAHKLIDVDKVDFIAGGHCSTETMTAAPIAEQAKVILLAGISSNPGISSAGDFVFRTSATGIVPSEMLSILMVETLKIERIAILNEATSYAEPPSVHLKKRFLEQGGKEALLISFNPGETDFKPALARIKAADPQALYIAVQAQDTAGLIVQQARQMGIHSQLFGNEVAGNAITALPNQAEQFEGLIYAEVSFDESSDSAARFIDAYNAKFHSSRLPYGIWTAESYDGVMLLAEVLNKCGPDKERVKRCLYEIKNYKGASGSMSIDEYGDGVRDFTFKQVRGGKLTTPDSFLASKMTGIRLM